MANVNMALDEIISSKRGRREGGAGRRVIRSGGVPSGKWKHDKFVEVNGGGRGGVRRGSGVLRVRAGANQIVKLNISNIPETVLTADLEELFQDFDIQGVAVHYDEAGIHLGTADLYANVDAAQEIMTEFSHIAIDGQEIKFAVVDESGAVGLARPRIQDRIRHVASNPIRKRKEQTQQRRGGYRNGDGSGRGSRPSGGPKPSGGSKLTVEELDKELESYMGKR